MLSQPNHQLRTLHELSLIALTSHSLENIAQRLVEQICSVTGFPIGAIELYNRTRQVMTFIGVQGVPLPPDTTILEIPVEQTLSGTVAATGQPVIKHYNKGETKCCETNPTLKQLGIETFICLPMIVNEHVVGVLSLAHRQSIEIDELFLEWIAILANFVASLVERRRAEVALQESEERFRQAFMHAPFPVMIFAEDGEVLQINHAWTDLTGYTHSEILTLAQWREKALAVNLAHQDLDNINQIGTQGELTIRLCNGELRFWQMSSTPFGQLADGRQLSVSMANDLTERKKAEARLRHDALHDGLTGLPNRLLLMDRLEQAIERARRKQDYRFALLFVDLDRFKAVNDSLGHWVGDRLLMAIACKLLMCVRAIDTVARLGGDEFILLLDELKDEQETLKVAHRIHEELKSSFLIEDQKIFMTASIGIAFNSSRAECASDLLKNADSAMYEAKARGKSCHVIFQQTRQTPTQK